MIAIDAAGVARWDGTAWAHEPRARGGALAVLRVGGRTVIATSSALEREDRAGWQHEALPSTAAVALVHRDEVWTLGARAHRRTGPGAFVAVALPVPESDVIAGAASAQRMVIIRRDRSLFERVADGWAPLTPPSRVERVAMLGATLVAIGQRAHLHDGGAWRELAGYPDDGYGPEGVAAISASDVWVVQYRGRLVRWDGARWSRVATPFPVQGVDALGADVVIRGADGRIARLAR